jgi:GDPmannose 4,6-dehydratase/GDP-4-dehydro-6-deoxy-D-mannose reductase
MVGSHMADFLTTHHKEVEVHGLIRWRSPRDNIRQLKNSLQLHLGDLRDLRSLIDLLERVRPARIFHLAAQSYVDQSFAAPIDTLDTNVLGTANLLEAMRLTKCDATIHICSSSEVYGQVRPDEVPIKESNPFRPASPYAVSKVGEDMLGLQYFLSYGIKTLRTRMFTHTGPRRGSVFAESTFAEQIAERELGLAEGPIKVGNLDSVRTITHVKDAVAAYWLLLEKCPPGEVYNIGGTETTKIGDILELLKQHAKVPIRHEVEPARLRPSDVTLQIPDLSKFRAVTGWAPTYAMKETLLDLLDYHRKRLQGLRDK